MQQPKAGERKKKVKSETPGVFAWFLFAFICVHSRFTSENALGSYSSTATVQTPALTAPRPIALPFVGRSFRPAAVDGLLKAAVEPVAERDCHNLRLISSMVPGDPCCWIISLTSGSSIVRLLALIIPTTSSQSFSRFSRDAAFSACSFIAPTVSGRESE